MPRPQQLLVLSEYNRLVTEARRKGLTLTRHKLASLKGNAVFIVKYARTGKVLAWASWPSPGSQSRSEHAKLERAARWATAADIFLQVACETLGLALAGGFLGMAVSWPTSRIISDSVRLPFVFDNKSALLAFVASVILNLAFSILPSRKAASVSPIEALRFE